MKVTTGTVVAGKIVVEDPELQDGTNVYIVIREPEDGESVQLSREELAELEAGIAEADRGEVIASDELFRRLRRFE